MKIRKNVIIFIYFICIAVNTQAAVTDLRFGYGKTMTPDSLPTTWVVNAHPESISDEYQLHQETYSFNSGEYVYFSIGLVNIDNPGSLFIDKIELTGPSGSVPINNFNFENGTGGWSAWGDQNIDGDFSISSDAYEGSSAAKLTVSNSGKYSLYGQEPVIITQSGNYTLNVYTKVYDAQKDIPPDDIFAMGLGNRWIYDSNVKREITSLDSTTFGRETYEMTISENGTQIGKDWYEVWKGYVRYWGLYDSVMYQFGFGLLTAWFPANTGDHKKTMAWVSNYATTVDLTVDILGIEPVILNFDTLDAYRLRYNLEISGPGGTSETTYDWWIVPYIGIVKQQTEQGVENLVSFIINRGFMMTETSDNDNDGILDYKELITYNTNPDDSDSDVDGLPDGDEIDRGTDPTLDDTDTDGLKDGWEVTYGFDPKGTNNAQQDPDNDGLVNIAEQQAGSNPLIIDTDGDGCGDGTETMGGRNPIYQDPQGDLNSDCAIDLCDVIMGLQLQSAITPATTPVLFGDVNQDGEIGLEEGIYALQVVAGTRLTMKNTCSGNNDCSGGHYCEKAVGACDGEGTCLPKPEACPQVFDPVCGCDGTTYPNSCSAGRAGANISYKGECNGR